MRGHGRFGVSTPATPLDKAMERREPLTAFSKASGITPVLERSGFLSPSESEYYGLEDKPLFVVERSKKRPRMIEEELSESKRNLARLERLLEDEREKSNRREKQLERELRLERSRLEQKEAEVIAANQQEEEYRRKLKQLEISHMKEKHELSDQLRKQERNARKMAGRHEELTQALQAQLSELKNEVDYARRLVEDKEIQLQRLRGEGSQESRGVDASSEQIEELQCKVRKLERERDDFCMQVEGLRHGVAVEGRASALMKQLRDQESRERNLRATVEALEKELKSTRENSLHADVLEKKLAHQSNVIADLHAAESQRDALLAEREEWTSVFAKILERRQSDRKVNPMSVLSVLIDLENTCAALTSQKGELGVKLTEQKSRLEKVLEAHKKAEAQLAKVEQACSQAQEERQDLERRVVFLTKERDSLLRIVDSVNQESFATLPKQDQASLQDIKSQHDKEMEVLKGNLSSAHARIAELETTLSEHRSQGLSPALMRTKSAQLQQKDKRIQALEAENKKLENQVDKQEDEIARLQSQINAGMFNPNKTKILHLVHNPQSKAFGNALAASRTVESHDPDKRTERLKQMFKEKTKAFKEAVYLLTGWKIDMMDKERTPQLRLRSMYAEKPADELIFQWNPNGEGGGLELLETPFCREMDENAFAYLTKCNSVPAFLSTLTMDLFGKQTLAL